MPGDTGSVARRTLTLLSAVLALLGATAATASAGGLAAPPSACPGQTRLDAPVPAQEHAMLCMVNYARAQVGLGALGVNTELEGSAREKTRDIFRCDSFSHYACGREFAYWIRASGYMASECWRAGENLAFGSGTYGSVRSIFRAWMRSTEHRENVLGDYAETGIDVATGTLEGFGGTRVWTQHFGSHCSAG